MDLKKNDICVVQITDMNHDGEGIGKLDGCPLFIKDAIVGDTVRVKIMKMKKTYGYARLEEIVESSPFRVEPRCAVARQCGGCQLQAMSYEKQLEFKQNKVKNNIERIGKITDYTMHPIIGMENPFRYRNKAQFPIGRNKDGKIIAGFYAGRTHAIIESDDCALGVNENKLGLNKVLAHMEKYNIAPYDEANHSGLVRHVFVDVFCEQSCLLSEADVFLVGDVIDMVVFFEQFKVGTRQCQFNLVVAGCQIFRVDELGIVLHLDCRKIAVLQFEHRLELDDVIFIGQRSSEIRFTIGKRTMFHSPGVL